MKIAVLPGDGIGPEVTQAALRVLKALALSGLSLVEAGEGAVRRIANTAFRDAEQRRGQASASIRPMCWKPAASGAKR